MNPRLLDQCRTYLLAHAITAPAGEPRPAPRAVTISRETGAGAITIGELVARSLQERGMGDPRRPWAVFDRNLVKQVLVDHKLPLELEKYMPEDAADRVEDLVEDLLGVHPAARTLAEHSTHTIHRLAQRGNVILVGRGGNRVTAHLKHVFHVRLIAPRDVRIRHVGEYYSLSRKKAAEFVRKSDVARARYVRRHFHASISDPLQYHITINTAAVDYPTAARLIVEAVSGLRDG
jgi:hypothetical protein